MTDESSSPLPLRREPPRFRAVEVRSIDDLSPYLRRVTLAGPDLDGLPEPLPAASVRLLLPPEGQADVVWPEWNGNEFRFADGERPAIRTLTPRRHDAEALELDVDVILHESGPLTAWARQAAPGARAAVSGPGRGYEIDDAARSFLLAGDESAIPAISQLLEALPPTTDVQAIIEVAHPDARVELPRHERATCRWVDLAAGSRPGDALMGAITDDGLAISPGAQVWVAGEAAAVQRIRKHLFDERGLTRGQTVVRGYWKHGRSQPG